LGPRLLIGDEQILASPEQPNTTRLLAAVPVPDPDRQRLRRVERDLLLADADDGDDSQWRPWSVARS
jgi:ABC-type oligopeptide transport system ATPase subunit